MEDHKEAQEEPMSENNSLESPVVAEWRIFSQEDLIQQKLEAYNNCYLCGTELMFTHVTNFISGEVIEEACCPSCNIRNKKEAHALQ